jgi:hypothetical protein
MWYYRYYLSWQKICHNQVRESGLKVCCGGRAEGDTPRRVISVRANDGFVCIENGIRSSGAIGYPGAGVSKCKRRGRPKIGDICYLPVRKKGLERGVTELS